MSAPTADESAPRDHGTHDIDHVVVAGGTVGDWHGFEPSEWERRLAVLRDGVAASGARWVTLFPVRAADDEPDPETGRADIVRRILGVSGAEEVPGRPGRILHRNPSSAVAVVVDTNHDGRVRFAAVVEAMRAAGGSGEAGADAVRDEAHLTSQLMAPCPHEPDLVVVLGPPDTLPTSLVWELAYSELVFLDLGWRDLAAGHLEMAVDDFGRRHRRFGGLDS